MDLLLKSTAMLLSQEWKKEMSNKTMETSWFSHSEFCDFSLWDDAEE